MVLLDENGQPAELRRCGRICIRAQQDNKPVGMFKGAITGTRSLRRQAWYDGYYPPGTRRGRDEHGYFWFVGRTDDVIKSSGYRIGALLRWKARLLGILRCWSAP